MKRATLISTAAALSILAGAVGVHASGRDVMHGGDHGPRFSFEEVDTNADGKVTPEEMQARMQARFSEADTDGDGKLSADEMFARAQTARAERMKKGITRMIEKRDTDGDGFLSIEEMGPKAGMKARFFEKLDADKDGAVSAEEFARMKEMRGKRDGHGEWNKGGHGHGKDGKRPMGDRPADAPASE